MAYKTLKMETHGKNMFSIPAEIRAMIFKKLPQTRVTMLRCMCQQLKFEIDDCYDFTVNIPLDIPQEVFIRLMEIRIKTFKLFHGKGMNISRRRVKLNLDPYNYRSFFNRYPERTTFFNYPHAIRFLDIDTDFISVIDYQLLLQECSQYLEKLIVVFRKDDNYVTGMKPHINFRNLKKLHIFDHRTNVPDSDFSNLTQENDFYLGILNNVDLSSPLTDIIVEISRTRKPQVQHEPEIMTTLKYTFAVFELIAQHKNTIEDACFSYKIPEEIPKNRTEIDCENFQDLISKFSFNHILFEDVTNLNTIVINYSLSHNPLPITVDSWKYLIRQQTKLQYIDIKEMGSLLEDSFLSEIVVKFSHVLRYLRIVFAFNENRDDVDFAMFQSCEVLKLLIFFQNKGKRRNAVNFDLPKSAEEVYLHGVNVKTSQLKEYFSQRTKLKKFEMHFGSVRTFERDMGVDGMALSDMIIQPQLILLDVTEFKFWRPEDDKILIHVLERINPYRPILGSFSAKTRFTRRSIQERFSFRIMDDHHSIKVQNFHE